MTNLHPDDADLDMPSRIIGYLVENDTRQALAVLIPLLSSEKHAFLAAHCELRHASLSLFPPSLDLLDRVLHAVRTEKTSTAPSVVVRERSARRRSSAPGDLDVIILRVSAPRSGNTPAEIDIFALPISEGPPLGTVMPRERMDRHETHLSFQVISPDDIVLAGMRAMLAEESGMLPDGGGYNPHADISVFYFRSSSPSGGGYQRLEIYACGHYPEEIDAHLSAAREEAVDDRVFPMNARASHSVVTQQSDSWSSH